MLSTETKKEVPVDAAGLFINLTQDELSLRSTSKKRLKLVSVRVEANVYGVVSKC